jgi:hypothetical protein
MRIKTLGLWGRYKEALAQRAKGESGRASSRK